MPLNIEQIEANLNGLEGGFLRSLKMRFGAFREMESGLDRDSASVAESGTSVENKGKATVEGLTKDLAVSRSQLEAIPQARARYLERLQQEKERNRKRKEDSIDER